MSSKLRLLAIAVIAVVAACGNSTGYGSSPPPPPPPPPPPGGHSTTITVSNNKYTPTPDSVAAGTVTFQWAADAVTHTVNWDTGPGTLPPNSGNLGASQSYQATLQVGTYTFHCAIHGTIMSGTIVVH